MPRLPASLSFRPGPLHRLDTPTSGIILFSTTLQGAQYFSTLIREHQVRKTYLAVVEGELTRPCTWKDALVRDRRVHKTRIAAADGPSQDAETQVVPLAVERGYTLIQARIPTGRTHQIRAQAAFHGHPLRGDRKYRGGFHAEGLLLHAYTLEFPLDAQGQGVPRLLTAPPSERFCKALGHLFGKHPLQDISDAPWDPRPE
jgi:23S rRNA pseudouridine955/2504/2580 synthase